MSNHINFGNANSGLQAGVIHGSVHAEFHAPPVRVKTPPQPSIVIPFSRDEHFIDQEATVDSGTILSHIDQKCRRPGSRTALVGLGGVGKSQLAIEYAYRIRERSPETWVFWIHASNAARFDQSVRDIAGCAKIFGRQDPKVDILQLVHDWLHNQAKGPWVAILDNVDDADVLTSSNAAREAGEAGAGRKSRRSLLSYIPHCQHGSVLVEPMKVEDAANLFRGKLAQCEADDEPERITSLVMALELMPLAIVQAAAYISQRWPRCSVEQYLKDYQASDRKKAGLLSYAGGELRRDNDAKNSILITWQMSLDHIRKERPSAADMLSLMSFCDRQGIPEILLRDLESTEQRIARETEVDIAEGTEDEEGDGDENADDMMEWSDDGSAGGQSNASSVNAFEDDVLTLRNYAFIRVSEGGQSFEMHRLVQLATLEWLQLHDQKERWRHRFLTNLYRKMPTGEYENWATCQTLFPHAQQAAAKKPTKRDSVAEWATVMYRSAWYCREIGNATEAERLSVSAMEVRKKVLEADHEDVLWATAMVASTYRIQGRWKDAEELEMQVMETRKKKLGEDHLDTLTSMVNLASTFWNQGRWNEAESLFALVVETRKTKLGAGHPDTLTSMADLASTLWNLGRLNEAESLLLEVIESRKTNLGAYHPDTMAAKGNLASTYRHQGRWKEAEELEVQVMEFRKAKLGTDHPDTLASMANLAMTYLSQDRWKEAEQLFVEVMETRKTKLGAAHPSTLNSVNNLAATYGRQNRWDEAQKLFLQVTSIRTTKLGDDHPDTLTSMANLGFTYRNQGYWKKAEVLEEKVLKTRKARLGDDHPDTLKSRANLAHTYWSQDRRTEAVNLMKLCVEKQKVELGAGHPHYRGNVTVLTQWESDLGIIETSSGVSSMTL